MAQRRFGANGEWWVVAQMILGAIAMIAPFALPSPVAWPAALHIMMLILGLLLVVCALALAGGGILNLGRNLTAVPRPKDDGHLIQAGVYSLVRHPIYAGVIIGAFGWALMMHSLAALVMAGVLFVFFDQKSRREEVWLAEKYADYPAYRQRVRKLIPFIF